MTQNMSISRILLRIGIAAAICGAAWLIYRALNRYSFGEITDALSTISAGRLIAAVAFAAGSYLCLTGFDYLGIRYSGNRLAYRRVALASFTSLSIGHNVGVAALSSGAIRYRFYSRWGLNAEHVAKIIIFSGITVGLGLVTIGGIGLLMYPEDAESLMNMSERAVIGAALACLAVPAAYLAASVFVRGTVRVRRWHFRLPRPGLAIAQIAVGAANYAFVAACLHQLLTALAPVPYLEVAAVYAIANGTALVSHVPGGLGVLEATVVFLLPGAGSVAAMIAFRIVYFFVPLALGLPLFLGSEYFMRPGSSASPRSAE
ncbi:lysylphosphatidylglycerol synthase domain-containing protein [Fodinicurvata sp. EGI_FJ10296]|uniref:lysylphosphatidylglycerol synthase domain-containing protein n=1 Tax=Fodinicurvata sp. EGI_FJ10296 TaxID=3231908 RepID=UPI0034555A02